MRPPAPVSLPAVFLDRDGVIVELVWDERGGAFESPNRPRRRRSRSRRRRRRSAGCGRSGIAPIVVSNQPAAAKGKATAFRSA